ncbi:hypothetical protein [Rhizobium sp. LCM 4573]|uniref:hypothetical protein n=1 Tax=Rhizobium sp. LCM 4573 TaxID=1848291 RepID=UPI0010422AD4|nr:hypothetical protein [Rhizobium sp. LCM 4573]
MTDIRARICKSPFLTSLIGGIFMLAVPLSMGAILGALVFVFDVWAPEKIQLYLDLHADSVAWKMIHYILFIFFVALVWALGVCFAVFFLPFVSLSARQIGELIVGKGE